MDYHRLTLENQTIFTKLVYGRLFPYNLSMGQPKVLEYIVENEGCMQKDIAKYCFIEPASVSSMLSTMEKDGLIRRDMIDGDRRSIHVFLTELGKEKAGYVKETFHDIETITLEGFTDKEKELLLTLLNKANQNLKNYSFTR